MWHSRCFACGGEGALHLHCRLAGRNSVSGRIRTDHWMQGYDGQLHGGIIATLLDSAMCQCLHLCGVDAVTAKLEVRFVRPVPLEADVVVSAVIAARRHGAYVMSGTLCLEGQVMASAGALFAASSPGGGRSEPSLAGQGRDGNGSGQ